MLVGGEEKVEVQKATCTFATSISRVCGYSGDYCNYCEEHNQLWFEKMEVEDMKHKFLLKCIIFMNASIF